MSSVKSATTNPLDKLLKDVGCPSAYQIFLFILVCSSVFPVSLNFIANTFYVTSPKFNCQLPAENWNWTKNESIPNQDGKEKGGNCYMYKDPSNISYGTTKCLYGYEYQLPGNEWPISAEWDLVCDKKYMGSLMQSVFFAGVMIGGLIFGVLGDTYGRRPVLLFTLYTQAILGVGAYFSVSYTMFVILKFFQGMMLQGLQTSNNSYAMELFETRYRTIAGMVIAMLATSCHMVIALVAYLIQDWRYIQLAISLPTGLAIVLIWLLPESLRWLMTKQKVEDATKVLKIYSKGSKVTIPEDIEFRVSQVSEDISRSAQQGVKADIVTLIKTPVVRKNALILFYCWFIAAVVYYGIQFSIPTLSGNKYLNVFIGGALETVSRFIGYFIIASKGRRLPLSICYILSGVLCIISATLSIYGGKDDTTKYVTTALALLGKACMGQCFAFILIVTSEIFPTVLRTAGTGACAVCARIGSIIAPQTVLLGQYIGQATPYIIFGVLSALAGILSLLMPETLNKALPNTVKDAEDIQSNRQQATTDNNQTSEKPPITLTKF